MDGFAERKKKHEEKWALDEALRFKAVARRNKLFGLWAAAEMGLAGGEAEAYAQAVVAADLHPAGSFGKVKADIAASRLAHDEATLRRKLDELEALAHDQVQNGG